jgi:hypothetical protein
MLNTQSPRRISLLILLASAIFCANAYAENGGWYGAVEFGEGDSSASGFDESDALSFYFGNNFSDSAAIEFGFVDMGEFDFGDFPDTFIEVSGIEMSLVGKLPANDRLSFFGKLGIFLWDLDSEIFGFDAGSDDGNSVLFGGGVIINFNQNIGGRISYQTYNDISDEDVDTLMFGLMAHF